MGNFHKLALFLSDLSDDDIGSILEKMSQIMSPSKSSQDSGSMSNSLYGKFLTIGVYLFHSVLLNQ